MKQNQSNNNQRVEALNRLIQPSRTISSSSNQQRVQHLLNKADTLMADHIDVTKDTNHLDTILSCYAQALELEPASSDIMSKVAWVEMKQGNFKKATEHADKALQINKNASLAYYVLGFISLQGYHYEESQHFFDQAIKTAKWEQNSSVRFFQAQNIFQLVKRRKGFFNKSFHLLSGVYMLFTAALFYSGDKKSIPLKHLLKIMPTIVKGYYYEEKGRLKDALMIYLKLYEQYPGMPNLTNVVGDLYNKLRQPHEALYWFEKTLKRHPYNEDALLSIAHLYEDKKEYEKALGVFKKLLTSTPSKAELHCGIANIYYYLEDMSNALFHYQSALTLSDEPKWKALIAQSLGNLHIDVWENTEAAKQSYQMSIELDPQNSETYIQLAMIHYRIEDFDNALFTYNKALKIDPKNPRIHANMGYLLWIQDELPIAIKHYERAIELDPFYEIPYNNLGVIYLDCVGDVQTAVKLLEKAASLNESYSLAYYNLGRAYSFLEQPVKAAGYFRTAQQLNRYTHDLDNEELEARILSLFDSNFEVLLDSDNGGDSPQYKRMM